MKPGVAATPDRERQPEEPPPRRHPDADQKSPPPSQQPLRPPADPEPDQGGDHRPAEDEEENARPHTRPDLPFSRPSPIAGRDL